MPNSVLSWAKMTNPVQAQQLRIAFDFSFWIVRCLMNVAEELNQGFNPLLQELIIRFPDTI